MAVTWDAPAAGGGPARRRGDLVVAADDRSGAIEAAATIADAGLGPVVCGRDPWPDAARAGAFCVVDLGSRHLDPTVAAEGAARVGRRPAGASVHKIDSTLRGNWAVEVVARSRAADLRPVVVAAHPALGRRCRDGVVEVHGVPVDRSPFGADPRAPVTDARPASQLRRAGLADVVEAPGAAELVAAWTAGAPAVVVDAETTDDVGVAVAVAQGLGALVVGPAAVVGAAASLVAASLAPASLAAASLVAPLVTAASRGAGPDGLGDGATAPRSWQPAGPVVVVCASLHPVARAQLDAARRAGVEVMATEVPDGPVSTAAAEVAVATLAAAARARVDRGGVGTLVVVGGDTAAAVLGDRSVEVLGSLPGGAALARLDDLDVVVRPGGYGQPDDGILPPLVGAADAAVQAALGGAS